MKRRLLRIILAIRTGGLSERRASWPPNQSVDDRSIR